MPDPTKAASKRSLKNQKKGSVSFRGLSRSSGSSHPLIEAVAKGSLEEVSKILEKKKGIAVALQSANEQGKTALMRAVELGRKDLVQRLLDSYHDTGEDVNAKDKQGYTAFHLACMNGNSDLIMLLLGEPALDVNAVNEDMATPLHFFCKNYDNPNLGDVWETFMKRKPLINAQNTGGETPLHKAIFNNTLRGMLVEALLEAGADVNAVTSKKESVLMFAIRMRRFPLVKLLTRHGADINFQNGRENLTPLQVAEQEEQKDVIKFITDVQELTAWLQSLDLEQYLPNFLKDEVFLDLVDQIDDRIIDSLGIKQAGARMKLLKAAKELTAKRSHSGSSSMDSITRESGLASSQKHERKRKKGNESTEAETQALQKELQALLTKDGKDWLIHQSELEFGQRLGAGASAKVVEGIYRPSTKAGTEFRVALKIFKTISDNQIDEFKKEMEIFSSVSSPYLVAWYGAALAHGKLTVVMELCSRGSLYEVLNNGPAQQFTWKKVFSWLLEMVKALEALHAAKIVHRDFKSKWPMPLTQPGLNVLVTEDWKLKVADFGLSRFTNQENAKQLETLGKLRGTYAYCAPEVGEANYTVASDVFSFGIVAWEVISRTMTGAYVTPYAEFGVQFDFQTMMMAKEGRRPSLPSIPFPSSSTETTPKRLAKVYTRMVKAEPADRPTTVKRLATNYLAERETWDALIKRDQLEPVLDTDE